MKKNSANYKDAMNSIKNNNVSDAVDELKLCLKFNSKSVSALNLLGLAYYLKCRFDKAEKTWRKSLSLQRDNNKARDYLELITKQDFKEIRKEYKDILFNDEANRNEKIQFLKKLTAEYDELIEPYVILGLLYKKDENYEKALEYFYQAYDLDSGNQNIKNYIMECEEEDKNSNAFNFKSETNKKSALIAGVIAVSLFAVFLNISGFSPFKWIEKNIQGFEFARSETEKNMRQQGASSNTENNSLSADKEIPASESGSENKSNFSEMKADNSESKSRKQNSGSLDFLNRSDLLQYKNDNSLISFDSIQELIKKEEQKQELAEASTFLEEGTEQELFNLGMEYFSNQDYQNAADIFNSIYNLTETDYLRRESLFLLARSHEKMDNYQSAEHFYRIYLNEYDDTNYYDEALYNLGLMLNEAGKAEKSREILKRLRRENPYSEYNNSQVYEILN
ncbi:tetratricopeptide repeat protein [Halanaerobium saccharolyticum]|uniref:Tetratricopeptide repeat protein n=1 Tax=Halanaerobium saccharolyticum TaxID=43595 RepID=A0A4R6M3G9_9FIRM|nr:tetratricopeptide repeat protein [Halanaerobium saccharolyticum]TDO94439.1 tetratricopeptide repeat protein [Halanaerobium saccharolyticum]